MFAGLTFDREPIVLTWGSFFDGMIAWAQTVGGFAAAAMVLYGLFYILGRSKSKLAAPEGGEARPVGLGFLLLGPIGALLFYLLKRKAWGAERTSVEGGSTTGWRDLVVRVFFIAGALWCLLGYLAVAGLHIPELVAFMGSETGLVPRPTGPRALLITLAWTVAGLSAIIGVTVPILFDLPSISLRRVLALARLSLKEAIRRKVLWGFLGLLLVVLFGSWFIPSKAEDEVRNYVQVISVAKTLLLIFAGVLIASFGIPDDIRYQTIHTVLTKPVQRFEIFLGRFLGYTILMTMVLLAISGLGLLYLIRNISDEAAEESLKAREPAYGLLEFEGTKDKEIGENVGREWEYRSYIFGPAPNQPRQYAIWNFQELPSGLMSRNTVRCEFTFDIYRTTKGREGEGVFCSFFLETWQYDGNNPATRTKYEARRKELAQDPKAADKLAEEFGYYEVLSKEVKDYHTQSIDFPSSLIRNALADTPGRLAAEKRKGPEASLPPLRLRVRCDTSSQFLGMARYDLYLRQDNPESGRSEDLARFGMNYLKGAFGVWLRLCLVIGVAVAMSTYLSGVITLLATATLFVLGFFRDYIAELAFGKLIGGGPVEAAYRLVRQPGGASPGTPLEDSTAVKVTGFFDKVFSWTLQRVIDIIPDVSTFTFTDYVAEGVAVSSGQMFWTFLCLIGYVLPFAVAAYYLLRWREVASTS